MTIGKAALGLLLLPFTLCAQIAPPSNTAHVTPDEQPVATLKISTRIVEISAVVLGKDGQPSGGLSKDDFILKQDGQEEPIHYFSQGAELPLTLALLVDTSGSQRTFIGDESLASDVFFQTMLTAPNDRATLVQFDAGVLQLRSLTSSSSALRLALNGLGSRPASANGTVLNDAVYLVSHKILAKETGRKAMVLLTDGGDNGSKYSLADAIEQAQRADVQIYSIVYSASDGPLGRGPVSLNPTHGPQLNVGLETLKKLSESTGGRIFTVSATNGLRSIYAQIAQELRLEYELGYTPPPSTQPNTYHKLELKARDRKLVVQARKGFFAQP